MTEDKKNFEILAGNSRDRAVHADGSEAQIHTSGTVDFDPLGRPVGMTGAAQDIEERKKAEVELRESEANFRALAENANDGIVITRIDGQQVYANDRAAEITGYSTEEFLRLTLKDMVHPACLQEVSERFGKRLRGIAQPRQYESVILGKDGRSIPIELTSSKTVWQGEPAGIIIFRDISERKKADEDRQMAEARYRALIDQLPPTIYIYNAALDDLATTLYVSPQVRSLGFSQDEWIANRGLWSRQIHPDDRERVLGEFVKAREAQVQSSIEYRLLTRDNDVRWFRDIFTIIKDENGRPLFFHGVMVDITESRLAEESRHLLSEVMFEVSLADDFKEALMAVLSRICASHDWCFGEVWIPGNDGKDISLASSWHSRKQALDRFAQRYKNLSFKAGEGLPGRVLTSKKSEWIVDPPVSGTAFFTTGETKEVRLGGCLGFPVMSDGRVLAVLLMFTHEVRTEDTRLMALVESISLQIGTIIHRKQAEDMLKEAEQRFRLMVENSSDAVLMADIESKRFVYANPAATGLLGYETGEIYEKTSDDITDLEQRRRQGQEWGEFIRDGRIRIHDRILVKKDGTRVHVDLSVVMAQVGGRRVSIGTCRDITEQQKASKAIIEKTAALDAMNKELNMLALELARLEEKERKRFAEMLHDGIGQNLVAIKMACEGYMISTHRPERVNETRTEVLGLLDATIDQVRSMTTEIYPANLNELGFKRALQWYIKNLFEPRKIRVTLEIDGRVEGLKEELKRDIFKILQEALRNSLKYSSGTTVEIVLRIGRDNIELSVKDDGKGFSPERFRIRRGHGVGLMLMRERVRALGGELKINSAPGKGTEVAVVIRGFNQDEKN